MNINEHGLIALANAADPEATKKLMTVDFAAINKQAAALRAVRDKANPKFAGIGPEAPSVELRKLRADLYALQERSKNTEIYTRNKAGEVHLLESQIADAVRQKRAAEAAGNDLSARNYEHAIVNREDECKETMREFSRAKNASAQAANDLKNWPHRNRIAELEQSLV